MLADNALTTASSHPTAIAIELSGQTNLLFRRNSLTGAIEVLSRGGSGITLNAALHASASSQPHAPPHPRVVQRTRRVRSSAHGVFSAQRGENWSGSVGRDRELLAH